MVPAVQETREAPAAQGAREEFSDSQELPQWLGESAALGRAASVRFQLDSSLTLAQYVDVDTGYCVLLAVP